MARPMTVADLKAAMSEGWPEVHHSDMALETMEINGRPINAVHHYHTSHGETMYHLTDNAQIFFSERDAVTAFWARYMRWLTDNTFDRSQRRKILIWREDPELNETDGTFSVVARFSCIFESQTNELRAA